MVLPLVPVKSMGILPLTSKNGNPLFVLGTTTKIFSKPAFENLPIKGVEIKRDINNNNLF